jgi:hypothetical protein
MSDNPEQKLAAHVVAWLQDSQWTVYQEVACAGRVADLVAVQGPLLWVIECKKAFTLALLEQAWEWRHFAPLISVAVPATLRRAPGRAFAEHVLQDLGIGTIAVSGSGSVREQTPARLNRQLPRRSQALLRDALHEQQKTFAAAGGRGGYWTPFKETCDNVRRRLQASGGSMPFKTLIESVNTHYRSKSTARACLRRWIAEGVIEGVGLEGDQVVLEGI